jgi:carbon-monoxide dehydrogenase large subunit
MTTAETASAPPEAVRFVGQSVRRVEDKRLVTGHGRYVDDVVLPGMLHVAFARSDFARARIVALDTTAAAALPGVHAVFTASELNHHVDSLRSSMVTAEQAIVPAHVLADGDVRFVGDPIALVVADNRYLAEDAIDLLDVEYEALLPVVDFEQAASDQNLVHPELGTNVAGVKRSTNAGVAPALANAAVVVTETFRQHRQRNMPMETRGLVVDWQPYAERVDIWASTQSPHELTRTAARVLSLGEHQVRVHMGDVGGAFGQKVFLGRDEIAVLLAARAVGRPLKWIEDRRENLIAANSARVDRTTVTMGLDDDARIVAAEIDQLNDSGAYPLGGVPANSDNLVSMFPGPYAIPLMSWSAGSVFTNTSGRGAYRGPWQMETVARELMIDTLARRIGMDPLELRRHNVIRQEDLPYTTATGNVYERISPAETLEQAVAMLDYDAFRVDQTEARLVGRYLGVGLALFIEPTSKGAGALGNEGAVVRVELDGSVSVYMGTGSHGQGLETTIAQVVADELGIDMAVVAFHQGYGSPYGFGTGGSRSAVIAGGAARAAASGVRQQILHLAAHVLEAGPEDLRIELGVVSVAGTPTRSVSVAELARTAYTQPEALPPDTAPGLEHSARYQAPPVTFSNAAHVCTCEVDVNTGIVTLLRYLVSQDCGVMVNPMIVQGQIAGGVAQGIGGALFEHSPYDTDGNPLAATMLDYLIPTSAEIPVIEIGHIVTPSDSPGGHKGVGEGGAIGSPPCVVNAVNDALSPFGVAFTKQPITPNAVLRALDEVRTESAD